MTGSGVALVTGGSRGIGRASALRLAALGYDVAVNYHSATEEAESVIGAIRRMKREAVAIRADVSNPAAVQGMVDQVVSSWGRIDVLLCNAGISAVRPFDEIEVDEWDRILAVNLKGTFLCCQRTIPVMKRQGSGRIILMASQAGITGGIFIGAHYSASKAGVICLAKSLAKQLAKFKIRVNAIAPGIVETEMVESYPADQLAELVGSVPLGRIGSADDVAKAVEFLASDASDYMTGATLHVNGGIYMP